jgi:hypothetical protein
MPPKKRSTPAPAPAPSSPSGGFSLGGGGFDLGGGGFSLAAAPTPVDPSALPDAAPLANRDKLQPTAFELETAEEARELLETVEAADRAAEAAAAKLNAASFAAKKAREEARRSLATDGAFYGVLVFASHADLERFYALTGVDPEDEFVDGYELAEKLGFGAELPPPPMPEGAPNIVAHWKALGLAVGGAEEEEAAEDGGFSL